jgi:hypothetical protein
MYLVALAKKRDAKYLIFQIATARTGGGSGRVSLC